MGGLSLILLSRIINSLNVYAPSLYKVRMDTEGGLILVAPHWSAVLVHTKGFGSRLLTVR